MFAANADGCHAWAQFFAKCRGTTWCETSSHRVDAEVKFYKYRFPILCQRWFQTFLTTKQNQLTTDWRQLTNSKFYDVVGYVWA